MVTLAINTASRMTSIALLEGKKVLREKSWESKNDEAEKLMPAIAEICGAGLRGGLPFKDLDKIIVVKGPGSFTGLRIGITVANMISYLQQIPIYSIDMYNFLRIAYGPAHDTALVLFAGKSEISIQFKKNDKPIISKISEAQKLLKERKIKKIFGELFPEQKEALKNFKFIKPKLTFGEAILKIQTKNLEKSKIVEPLYIKSPDISIPKPIK
ncbi:MAG: tRNA (adenosine(37)-N6)-threonylcarbamoyltransferase complex dimerization subunit type 1 TsaB [Candidatus Gracilibacteria bacterium]